MRVLVFRECVSACVIVGSLLVAQAGTTASSVVLTASPSPAPYGQAVTLTAAVASGMSGQVTFYDGVTVLGVAAVSSSHATLTTSLLPAGTHNLHARYSGDSIYASSNSAMVSEIVIARPETGFSTVVPYPTGFSASPASVGVGDFNGDGKPDLAIPNYVYPTFNQNSVTIMLNNGDGTYRTGQTYPGSIWPLDVLVADFNGDGNADLFALGIGNGTTSMLLLGNGDGTFRASSNTNLVGGRAAAIADFNGDGFADFLVVGSLLEIGGVTRNDFAVQLGKGDGTFQDPVYHSTADSPYSVAVGDFDGDGKADVAIAYLASGSITVQRGNGDGSFQPWSLYTAGLNGSTSIAAADFDGDGVLDLAVAQPGGSAGSPNPGMVSVFLGRGDGTFRTPVNSTAIGGANSLAVGDFNGDGKADLAIANSYGGSVSVMLGNGDGTLQAAQSYSAGTQQPLGIRVADVNGDGSPDLVFTSLGTFNVLLGLPSPKAIMLSPAVGSVLNGPTVTFTWSAGIGGSAYWLDVGTAQGQGNIFGNNVGLSTSQGVSGIPTNGSNIYVRLWTQIGGNWSYNDYSYTAATGVTKAVMSTPLPGSTLSSSSVTFNWTGSAGASAYWLDVGTAQGQGNIFGGNVGLVTSRAVTGIPTAGGAIYARLWTQFGGNWTYNDYAYTAASYAVMTTPPPGSTLGASSVTFNWTGNAGASAYWLDVGTVQGQGNIFGGNLGLVTSRSVSGIPTNGATIYVRLWTQLGGNWSYIDYTYTAARGAAMVTPAPGSALSSSSVTFSWTAGSGASAYWLDVGTIQGQGNIFGANLGLVTSQLVSGIVGNGSIYVRLWTQINGAWSYNDYIYTASSVSKAVMTAPSPGSSLSGSSTTFSWTAGAGASAYWLDAGTIQGQGNIFGANVGLVTSQGVSGIPTGGIAIYVRLWTQINGTWYFNDYTYTAL